MKNMERILNFSFLLLCAILFTKCSSNQKREEVIVRLNPNFITKPQNIEIKDISEIRKFYIENSNTEITIKLPKQVVVNIQDIE